MICNGIDLFPLDKGLELDQSFFESQGLSFRRGIVLLCRLKNSRPISNYVFQYLSLPSG
jgi:hypothetical protein